MNRAAFEASLREGGYEMVPRDFAAGAVHAEHSHGFDARLMVTAGEITLTIAGNATTYGVGDVCEVPAGTPHTETIGARGATLLLGRRHKAA
jgi:quercetin dioxygenase-like cupin family protein